METKIDVYDEEEETPISTDSSRSDEKWNNDNEKFFHQMKSNCLHKSNQHDIVSHKNKKRYIWASIPSTIIPLILANVNQLDIEYMKYINSIGLTCVSIISGIATLQNFAKKTEIHNTFSGKYAELASDIDKFLVRKKRYREPFDVILERFTTKYNNLNNEAPYL